MIMKPILHQAKNGWWPEMRKKRFLIDLFRGGKK